MSIPPSNHTAVSYKTCHDRFPSISKLVDPKSMTYGDITISWGGKGGSAAALVGLGRGRDAILEAAAAMGLADQVCIIS